MTSPSPSLEEPLFGSVGRFARLADAFLRLLSGGRSRRFESCRARPSKAGYGAKSGPFVPRCQQRQQWDLRPGTDAPTPRRCTLAFRPGDHGPGGAPCLPAPAVTSPCLAEPQSIAKMARRSAIHRRSHRSRSSLRISQQSRPCLTRLVRPRPAEMSLHGFHQELDAREATVSPRRTPDRPPLFLPGRRAGPTASLRTMGCRLRNSAIARATCSGRWICSR